MLCSELKARRVALKLSQAELAQRLGVTQNTVARWERGTVSIERPLMVQTLLGVIETEMEQQTDQERHDRSVKWWRYEHTRGARRKASVST